MSTLNINDHVDHQRWLIENGFINDLHKDNIYMYGSLVHKEIEAVEVRIDVEKKLVEYDLYMATRLLKQIDKFNGLSKQTTIFGLWQFKRMLRKEGNLHIHSILNNFVKDYLGPKWNVVTNLKDIKEYEEGIKQETGASAPADQPVDPR